MNANHKLCCRHCGTEIEILNRTAYNKRGRAKGSAYIETEIAIRCPHCLHRLNQSEEIFRSQIVKFPIAG